ncbi:unnamed protein product, partial [Choristocarpus tenellus]
MLQDSEGTSTSLAAQGGSIGMALNGVAIYSAYAGVTTAVSFSVSAYALESDTFDLCGGHAAPGGSYHYHSAAGCLEEQIRTNENLGDSEHSPQIGWAF